MTRPGERRSRRCLVAALLAAALLGPTPQAAADDASESTSPAEIDLLEAAVLYRVFGFLDWPKASSASAPEAPLVVAVLGKSTFLDRLRELTQQPTARGRKLELRRIEKVEEATGADVVVLASPSEVEAAQALQHDRAVLVVGRTAEAADKGACLALFPARGRIRIRINQRSLREAHIAASYQLLALSEVVGAQ
jgi:hypothetical protein